MNKSYNFFSKASKIFSNGMLMITIPISIFLFAFSMLFVLAQQFLSAINLWTIVEDIFKQANNGVLGGPSWEAFRYAQLAFLIVAGIIFILWLISFIFWIVRISIYKKVDGMLVARNKEFRNYDINRCENKLEKYRYRDF